MKSKYLILFFITLIISMTAIYATGVNDTDVVIEKTQDTHVKSVVNPISYEMRINTDVYQDNYSTVVTPINQKSKHLNVSDSYSYNEMIRNYKEFDVGSYDELNKALGICSYTYNSSNTINLVGNDDYVGNYSINYTIDHYANNYNNSILTINGNNKNIITNNNTFILESSESNIVINYLNFINSTVQIYALNGVHYYEMDMEFEYGPSTIIFNQCKFINSTVKIHTFENTSLINCEFNNINEAYDEYAMISNEIFNITNCSFINNKQALLIEGANRLKIVNSKFINNSYKRSKRHETGNFPTFINEQREAFINNYNGNTTIEKCTFIGNKHPTGALINIINTDSTSNITSNMFLNNTVQQIIVCGDFLKAYDSYISFNNFVNNNVQNIIKFTNMTIYHVDYHYLIISDNKFRNNNGSDGSLLHTRYRIQFLRNHVNNNTSQGLGLILNTGKLVSLKNNFTYNTASKGGVVYNYKLFKSTKDYLNHNIALKHGGCIYNRGIVILNSATMKYNYAQFGAVIFNYANSTINISKANIYRNKAEYNGTIYNNGTIYMNYTTINDNKAKHGGVIFNAKNFTAYSSAFKNNTADIASALYNSGTYRNMAYATLNKCVLTLNKAHLNATIFNNATVNLTDTNIKNMGVNNYLIINYYKMQLNGNCTIINTKYPNEEVIKNYS